MDMDFQAMAIRIYVGDDVKDEVCGLGAASLTQ